MAVCALTMFDGMGDEMTAAAGVLALVLAMVLAWLSTHVADRGDHIFGTILTVGAHASLIGLGGHDGYSGGPASSDAPEQLAPQVSPENKPEELGESGSEAGEGDGARDGGGDTGPDRLMNIQSKPQHTCAQSCHDDEEEDDDDDDWIDEEDDDLEEDDREEMGQEEKTVAKLGSMFSDSTITSGSSSISVRFKFLNDTEEVAIVSPQETVGLLKRYFSGRERQVKLIYRGQLLQDPKRSLASLNVTHNSVIHCHVCQVLAEVLPEEGAAQGAVGRGVSGGIRAAGVALGTSSPVVPVFVVILAVVWYFRINYRQFFTAPATISLVGVTVFFSFLIFGMHGR